LFQGWSVRKGLQPLVLEEHTENKAAKSLIFSVFVKHRKADFNKSAFQCFLTRLQKTLGSGCVQCAIVRQSW
jgi:hypothetical protein